MNVCNICLKIINYNCRGHKFNIFLKYFGSIFKTELSVICSLWNILREKFHRIYVLNVLTVEIVCAQYKRGNSSLYLIFLLMCQFIIEFTDVDAFVAALDIGLLLCYQFSMAVTCWKIINCSLSVECEFSLLFFRCKQFKCDISVFALC